MFLNIFTTFRVIMKEIVTWHMGDITTSLTGPYLAWSMCGLPHVNRAIIVRSSLSLVDIEFAVPEVCQMCQHNARFGPGQSAMWAVGM